MKNIEYYIVEGGHDGDPDPEQLGRVRLRKMGAHGEGVLTEHLPFSQLSSPVSGTGQHEFNRPPPPGTLVIGHDAGESVGYAFPIGIPHGKHEKSPSIPGNASLPFLSRAKEMASQSMKIVTDMKSEKASNVTGISKFKKVAEEKGDFFKQSLNDSIATHGSPFAISGIRNLPLEKIQTALDQATSAMDASKLSGLGESFNLGGMLQGLDTSSLGLPSGLGDSLGAITKMMPQDKGGAQPEWGAMLGNLGNPSSLMSGITEKLKGITNTGQLMDSLKDMQSPEFLQKNGANNTPNVITIETPFGPITQNVFANGASSSSSSDSNSPAMKAVQQLMSLLSGILQGGPGETLFSQQGTPLPEMMGRMKDMAKQQNMTSFMENLSNQNRSKENGRVNGTENGNKNASRFTVIEKAKALFPDLENMQVPFVPKRPSGSSMS